MSGKPVSFRASEVDRERLAQLAEDEDISKGQAARRALDHGLEDLGYGSATRPQQTTTLAGWAWEISKTCLWFAFAVGGAQLATPADFSVVVVGFVAAAIGCLGLMRAEPGVSEWVSGLRLRGSDPDDGGSGEVAD